MTRLLPIFLVLAACTPTGATRPPSLGEIVNKVDVRRVLQCASEPTAIAKARCLGAQAMTTGLELALERAAELAGNAIQAMSPAGAGDVEADDPTLAADLDSALANLQREIGAAQ